MESSRLIRVRIQKFVTTQVCTGCEREAIVMERQYNQFFQILFSPLKNALKKIRDKIRNDRLRKKAKNEKN